LLRSGPGRHLSGALPGGDGLSGAVPGARCGLCAVVSGALPNLRPGDDCKLPDVLVALDLN
jgi:hypothetical protein